MMERYIEMMQDPREIAKIQQIMKDAVEGGVAVIDPAPAPAQPVMKRVMAKVGNLASIEEGHESDEKDKDTGRK